MEMQAEDWVACAPKGWHALVRPLVELCLSEGVEIHDVKEKFGGLRFYTGAAPEHVEAAIDAAEQQSYTICEQCGEPGQLRRGGWLMTLCDEHAEGRPVLQVRGGGSPPR